MKRGIKTISRPKKLYRAETPPPGSKTPESATALYCAFIIVHKGLMIMDFMGHCYTHIYIPKNLLQRGIRNEPQTSFTQKCFTMNHQY